MALSFSMEIKQEIIENKQHRMRGELFWGSGLFMSAKAFSADKMCLRSEIPELAQLYARLAKIIAGDAIQVEIHERKTKKGIVVYRAEVTQGSGRELILQNAAAPDSTEDRRYIGAFLSGAFLACGSASNPEKSYRLEFAVHDAGLADKLARLTSKFGLSPGVAARRGQNIVYFDECGQIQDILTMMGASRAALKVIDVEMIKQVRNQANRAANLETANIDKQVEAAMSQVRDIELLLREVGMEGLPEPLMRAAELRLKHPEASFRELVELSPEPITRSGLYHRYAAIAKMAVELRDGKSV